MIRKKRLYQNQFWGDLSPETRLTGYNFAHHTHSTRDLNSSYKIIQNT